MRHLKSEVDSIKKDMECGLRFDDQTVAFQPGDLIVSYKIRQEQQYTDWNPGFWMSMEYIFIYIKIFSEF